MSVLLLETIHEEAEALLGAHGPYRLATDLRPAAILADAERIEAIVTRGRGRIPAQVIEGCPRLKCVARCGVGLDNIDVAAATRRGLPVIFAPGASGQSVAEHTLLLALAVAKHVARLDRLVRDGRWDDRMGYRGVELAGRTLGVIGLGDVGRRVARLATAIGMRVLYWSRRSRDAALEFRDLPDLLAEADVVTLHLSLTPETHGFLDATRLAQMKRGAILINTARGALVDEAALAESLRSGHLFGVGLDVLAEEPPAPDHPLLHLPQVVITPHTAALTESAYRRMCVETIENMIRVLRGEPPEPRHVANRAALVAPPPEGG